MSYKVKFVSQKGAALSILPIIVFGAVLGLLFVPREGLHDNTKVFFLVTFWGLSVWCIWQWLATVRAIWTVDENGIEIHWTKKSILSRGDSVIMAWSEIEKIYRGPDPQYYTLKIKPVSDKVLKFYHDPLTTRDEFRELLDDLDSRLNSMLKQNRKSLGDGPRT